MATELQTALAKLAADTKTACATSADVSKAALAKPAATATTTGFAYGTKAFILAHSVCLAAGGGFIAGIAVYHLANKLWFNKNDTAEPNSLVEERS